MNRQIWVIFTTSAIDGSYADMYPHLHRNLHHNRPFPASRQIPSDSPLQKTKFVMFKRRDDLSASLSSSLFKIDYLARYGLHGKPQSVAYDPVQGLLAVGTNTGDILVIGQYQVEVPFKIKTGLDAPVAIVELRIVKGVYLVVQDAENVIHVISLETKEILHTQFFPSIKCIESDPALDWLFVGQETGTITVFDIDRGNTAPYRISNLVPSLGGVRMRSSPLVSIQLHPREVSVLLICYEQVAVVFSVMQNAPMLTLKFELPRGAPGGQGTTTTRTPKLVSGRWHPNGSHILTAYADGSLCVWDAKEGKLLQARTLMDTDVNIPRSGSAIGGNEDSCDPVEQILWLCTQNVDETSWLVVGGNSSSFGLKGMSSVMFNPTPNVSITSYQAMGQHYAQPTRQKVFPLPEGAVVHKVLPLPVGSPYFHGCFNPQFLLVLLESGEFIVISYPDGATITDPTMIPPAIGWISPFISTMSGGTVPKNQWLGMMDSVKPKREPLFFGGAARRHYPRRTAKTNVLCTGHTNGTVKLWDASYGELDDKSIMEINVASAVNRGHGLSINHISFAGAVGEVTASTENGDVVFFRYGQNRQVKASGRAQGVDYGENITMEDLEGRLNLSFKYGFIPQLKFTTKYGGVSSVYNSGIGFIAVGTQSGNLIVVNLRNKSIIVDTRLSVLEKRSSRPGKSSAASPGDEITALHIGIYALDGDSYSSIVLSAGTAAGNLYTFRIIPDQGSYKADYAGSINIGSAPVHGISVIDLDRGTLAEATPQTLQTLAQGVIYNCATVLTSSAHIRVVKQPATKISHKRFSHACLTAGVSCLRDGDGLSLICIMQSSKIRALSLPGLKEIAETELHFHLNDNYARDSQVGANGGDVVVRGDKNWAMLISVWGTGRALDIGGQDDLYDVMKTYPPRPTISAFQWVTGRQFTTIADLDILIGGPRRPKSKFQIAQESAQAEQERMLNRKQADDGATAYRRYDGKNRYYANEDSSFPQLGGIGDALDNMGQAASEGFNSMTDMFKGGTSSAGTSVAKTIFKAKFL